MTSCAAAFQALHTKVMLRISTRDAREALEYSDVNGTDLLGAETNLFENQVKNIIAKLPYNGLRDAVARYACHLLVGTMLQSHTAIKRSARRF
jgi:hypothetical protein